MLGRGFLLGAAAATAGLLLVPGVAVAVARAGRPLARATLKTSATAYDEFRKAGAEAYEHFEDLAAEVKSGLSEAADDITEDAAQAAGPTPDAKNGPNGGNHP